MTKDEHIKSLITDTAKPVILNASYRSLRVDDIASELSISKKTIYDHFPSKAEILKSVIDKERFAFRGKIQSVLNRLIEGDKFDFFAELKKFAALIKTQVLFFTDSLLSDVKTYIPDYFEECKELDEYSKAQFIKIYEIGIEHGFFDKNISAEVFYHLHRAAMKNLLMPDVIATMPFTVDQMLQNVFDVLYKGVLTDKSRDKYNEFFEINS